MSTKFYTLLTDIGAAKLANATALGVPLKITQMAVGDGGGILPTPNSVQTSLIAEKRRANLNSLSIDPKNSSQIIAEQVIPESEGGWWIREVGLFDESGTLIAVGNCPETYKPLLAEGSGRTQTVRMVLITSSAENITLKIDPSVVLATRKYVDDKVLELRVYVDEQLAKKMDKVANGADIANVGEFLRNLGIGDNSSRASTGFFPQGAVTLPVNTDLNTQKIPGAYYQQSNSAVVKSLNYPEDGFAGSLLVLKNGANGNDGCVQEYTLYHSGSTYRRVYNVNSKSWTEWDRIIYASELNKYSGLESAKYITSRGANANGAWQIWSDGAIELFGSGGANSDNGLVKVIFPIALPSISRYISIAERIRTNYVGVPNVVHSSMIVDDQVTKTGFYARCQMYDGKVSNNAFSWRVYYAPV